MFLIKKDKKRKRTYGFFKIAFRGFFLMIFVLSFASDEDRAAS